MLRPLIAMLLLAAISATMGGCAATSGPGGSRIDHSDAGKNAPFISQPREIPVFRADGRPATWSELITAASQADAVILGENHGHATGLAVAAAIWEDLLAAPSSSPNGPALALEFWERDEQITLDDFLTGVTDDAAFIKASGKAGAGKASTADDSANFPHGHREMIRAAKARNRPVIAANAPRRYVRLARTEGFDRLRALNARQQEMFRIPDTLPEGRYRDDFEKVMGGTALSEGPRQHDDMFRSQSVWDWTMSHSVARLVDAGNTPAVLVVGRFHSDHRGGLVQALESQRPGTRIVTASFIETDAPSTIPDEDKGRADFIIYAGKR
jgi:uncharacterized iron-regulated protein